MSGYIKLAIAAVLLALGAAAGFYPEHLKLEATIAQQEATLQKINADNATALANYQKQETQLATDRDSFKTQLEQQYEANQQTTAALQLKYNTLSLRYRASSKPGANSNSAASTAPSAAEAPIIQLPDSVTINLRQLAADADALNDSYKLCYSYATGIGQVK
jgi:hypothetical protein